LSSQIKSGGIGGDTSFWLRPTAALSVELAASLSEGVVQPVGVGEVIVFAEEAGVAVVPALHDVQGQTVKMGTATTWHTKSVSRADEAVATGVKLSLAPCHAFSCEIAKAFPDAAECPEFGKQLDACTVSTRPIAVVR
jgi:hypothetical protein